MVAPAIQGTATGGRQGNGTFSVTPPASSLSYRAYVMAGEATTTLTATGWTEVYKESVSGLLRIFEATSPTPGSSWTVANTPDSTAPTRMVVIGFTQPVSESRTLGTPNGLTCPSKAVGAETLVARVIVGANTTDVNVGYPAAATLGRDQSRFFISGAPANVWVAVAFQEQATAATVGTAAFSVGGTLYGSDVMTIAYNTVPPTAPSGLALTAQVGAIGYSFDPVAGADSYILEYRQTGLTAPSTTTQTSAPKHLYRMYNASTGGATSYPYTWRGTGVRYYCIDSGVRLTHNEFTGRTATGFSLGATSPGDDTINHGTGAASLLGGTSFGVAKDVTIVSVQCIDASTSSSDPLLAGELEDVVDFILSDKGSSPAVATITLSLDGMQLGGTNSSALQTQLTRLLDAGVPVVIASANLNTDITSNVAEGDSRIIWAGSSFPDTDARTPGSNYGPANLLFAPVGEEGYSGNVTTSASNTSDSATKEYGATSGATPAIGGVVAKNKQANPQLSPARIQEVLFSQARRGIITSVPAGPNHMVNANAIITDWTQHPVSGTSGTLDGLGDFTAWEFRVRTVDGGISSDPSSTQSATTLVTGTLNATTPAVTVAVPTVAWSGTVSVPVYSGTPVADTPTVSVAVPTVAWSGTFTPPGVTGSVVADTPTVTVDVPTVSWTGAVTAPVYAGSVAADTPTVSVAVPTAAWTGTFTPPVYAGTLTADTPAVAVAVPTVAWSGTFTAPGVIGGSITADTPPVTVAVPTVVWAGTFTPPVYTGTLVASTPGVTVGVPTCVWTGTVGGGGPTPIPVHRTLTLTVPHRTLGLTVPHRTLEWSPDE